MGRRCLFAIATDNALSIFKNMLLQLSLATKTPVMGVGFVEVFVFFREGISIHVLVFVGTF